MYGTFPQINSPFDNMNNADTILKLVFVPCVRLHHNIVILIHLLLFYNKQFWPCVGLPLHPS